MTTYSQADEPASTGDSARSPAGSFTIPTSSESTSRRHTKASSRPPFPSTKSENPPGADVTTAYVLGRVQIQARW
jgi:hypothetical protein